MTYEQNIFDHTDGVVSITLNQPDKLNAFTFKMLDEVNHVLTRETGRGARVVVFRGAGRRRSSPQPSSDEATGLEASVRILAAGAAAPVRPTLIMETHTTASNAGRNPST